MPKRLFISFFLACVLFVSPASAQGVTGPVYIVQSGDTLSSIAVRFNISLTDLMNANGISDPNLLSAGQELVIPGLEGISGVLVTEVIQYGDSFVNLSRRTQVPEALLQRLNRLVSPSELYVGTSLVVPLKETDQILTGRITPGAGESLLELAVRQGMDPWLLATTNRLSGTWDALPGDVLYTVNGNPDQSATGLPAIFNSARVSDLPLKQGGTAVVRVEVPGGVTLGGMLVDKPLQFFPGEQASQVALQGVHAMLAVGSYPLRLDATLPDGTKQSFEQMVLVTSGNYPEDPLLYVDPATIDPAATETEQKKIEAVVSRVTAGKLWSGAFLTPASLYAESTYFTSRYGNRRTYIGQGSELKVESFHTGLDFGGGTGLPITAPAAGVVVFTESLTVRGNATIIDHGWGVYSGFWHQSEFKVQVGEIVEQGQIIGLVGGTGRVTGAHLHWELWVNGIQVDPLDWLVQIFP